MGKIVSIASQKGGTGKTVSTYTMGLELSKRGLRVLLVDIDPQANLTFLSGVNELISDKSITDVFINKVKMKDIIVQVKNGAIKENFYLVPSSIALFSIENILNGVEDKEYILKKALYSVKEEYDVILIDCPPTSVILQTNALTSSDYVIIPSEASYLSNRYLQFMEDIIFTVKENFNKDLKLYGILITQFEEDLQSKKILDELQDKYDIIGIIPNDEDKIIYSLSDSEIRVAPDSEFATAYKNTTNKIYEDILHAKIH